MQIRPRSHAATSQAFAKTRLGRVIGAAFLSCATLASLGSMVGCSTLGLRSAVSMKMTRDKASPKDASVYIDEEFIGPLYYVAAHGVRLPTGKHRISVTKDGYFPWDREVVADRQAIVLDVELTPVPD